MLRQLGKIASSGRLTEALQPDDAFEVTGERLSRAVRRRFGGSFALRHVDAGSCNGCELEVHAMGNVYHDLERFGLHFVASPRHADGLLVTGVVTRHMETALLRTWQALAEPRLVLAAGVCAIDGGEFGESYASRGALANIIPVDAVVHGCPPTPLALLNGILALIESPARRGERG